MAIARFRPNRGVTGKNHSRSTRVGQSQVQPAIHAPSRRNGRSKKPVAAKGVCKALKGIADTGFLVAFVNRRDNHHEWAGEVASRVTEPLLTCESVCAETAFHLQSVSLVLEMIADGLIRLAFDASEHHAALTTLAKRYRDRNPDFADLCLIRMSEMHPRHIVITTDRADFRVYRRNKREVIPSLCPP